VTWGAASAGNQANIGRNGSSSDFPLSARATVLRLHPQGSGTVGDPESDSARIFGCPAFNVWILDNCGIHTAVLSSI
jgi:hypothetical protein